MRGIGAQLRQIRRIDLLFGARGRSHYGLQSCLSTEWELWGARRGVRWWLVPAKKVKQGVGAGCVDAGLCKGLGSRYALGTQSGDASCAG